MTPPDSFKLCTSKTKQIPEILSNYLKTRQKYQTHYVFRRSLHEPRTRINAKIGFKLPENVKVVTATDLSENGPSCSLICGLFSL